jgi:hypothetical protein
MARMRRCGEHEGGAILGMDCLPGVTNINSPRVNLPSTESSGWDRIT